MKHFASSAHYADNPFISEHAVLRQGEKKEREQLRSTDKTINSSAYDYEDLTSNLLGTYFEKFVESEAAIGLDFAENLRIYLKELGFVNDPTTAPNFEILRRLNIQIPER